MSAVTTTTTTTMTTVVADCELLGRGPVQGSADSDSLAALVRQLCKQQQRARLPGRRCAVSCTRDAGLEIVPHHRLHHLHHHHRNKRPDDEGFESDEDLASLGSYEDPGKRTAKQGGGGMGGSSGGAGALAVASAAAGVASDSANSSGVSEDSDDADAASLKGQPTLDGGPAAVGDGRETYGLADVAFCHTDAVALPGIAVWVIKTRRAPHAAGLEAIVFRCHDGQLQDVCRAYQEHSRRLKLEPKPWAAQAGQQQQQQLQQSQQRRKVVSTAGHTAVGGGPVNLISVPLEVNRYSLVQRTDTDGVTHIEVTTGPVVAGGGGSDARGSPDFRRSVVNPAASAAVAPSSIISLSTPESPRPTSKDGGDFGGGGGGDDEDDDDADDGGNLGVAVDGERPPQRPERRKHKPKVDGNADVASTDDSRRQQKVVRGQFIRVNVNHHATAPPASPEPERTAGARREQPAAKPAMSDRLWSTADYDRLDGRYTEHHHRSSSRAPGGRTRSRSTGPGRRQQYPLQLTAVQQQQQQHPPPVATTFSRYQTDHQQQSFGTRFFGKLREITSGGHAHDLQPVTFRRRNSVGESAATANFHQYFSHHHHLRHGHEPQPYQQQYQQTQQYQPQQQLHHHNRGPQQPAKNCGHLKSVIKKNNKSQLYQHAFDEPKKVTFSAYATVQVVD